MAGISMKGIFVVVLLILLSICLVDGRIVIDKTILSSEFSDLSNDVVYVHNAKISHLPFNPSRGSNYFRKLRYGMLVAKQPSPPSTPSGRSNVPPPRPPPTA
ncbi:hypothetical protein M5689_020299 [Euphorbia peplus]|nr:hypothetical protein M5689_020299 [Euphorbia peplus]